MNIINSIKQTMYKIRSKNSFKKDTNCLDKLKRKYVSQKEKLENEILLKTGKTIDELDETVDNIPSEYLDDLIHINGILVKLNDVIIDVYQYRIDVLSGKINTICKW